jgi:iron-sulfur cluster repair protein YtfE (RIC family)
MSFVDSRILIYLPPNAIQTCIHCSGMPSSFWNIQLGDVIPPSLLCTQIERECHPELLAICNNIEGYFLVHADSELTDTTSETVQLLFSKLEDEMKHLLLKEKSLLFPAIQNRHRMFVLAPGVWKYIMLTQQSIAALLLRLRMLLNHFQIIPAWNSDWSNCVQQFFQLEKKVHQWIFVEQNILYPACIQSFSIH